MASSKIVFGLLALIFVFHMVAIQKTLYWTYTWLDIPMHILGGIWAALFFAWLAEHTSFLSFSFREAKFMTSVIMTLGFVALCGIGWEFYEFIYDVFFSVSRNYAFLLQLSAADTMADLFFDIFGGAIGFLCVYVPYLKSKA